MEVTGTVEKLLPAVSGQTKTGDTWQKQTFLLRTEDEYDNLYPIEAFGKAMEHLNGLSVGQKITAHFNVKCNEYQGKYYVSLGLWKIEKIIKDVPQQQAPTKAYQAPPVTSNLTDESNDLPF
jgi:hypothetical protein